MTRPRIVMIVPSGEGVRNFVYSGALQRVAHQADVTLLSIVTEPAFAQRIPRESVNLVPLVDHPERESVRRFRYLVHMAHLRWLWSGVARNGWESRDAESKISLRDRMRWASVKVVARSLAYRPVLEQLTKMERWVSYRLRPTRAFDELMDALRPDLVFNTMHVHGPAGDLPVRVARRMGIPTAAFIYSWDNLTSRSRIFAPYDDLLVWTSQMRRDVLQLYREARPERVHVVGSPQFDFHAKPEFRWTREQLAERLGIDPRRPFVLYTTGVDRHFPEEHRTVAFIAERLAAMGLPQQPQLVVRTYVKGTSEAMREMLHNGLPHTTVAPMDWDERFFTSSYDDLTMYSSLLHHCTLGVNAASTVTLELLALGKPVINLWLDPPGSRLPHHQRWSRHILFDHFRPVAESGATMVARSPDELTQFLLDGLTEPERGADHRARSLNSLFGEAFSGHAADAAAETILALARRGHPGRSVDSAPEGSETVTALDQFDRSSTTDRPA